MTEQLSPKPPITRATIIRRLAIIFALLILFCYGYKLARTWFLNELDRAAAAVMPLDHTVLDLRQPPLQDYYFNDVFGMTVNQLKQRLTKEKPAESTWSFWPNYIRGYSNVCHSHSTYEFLITNGTISAIRQTYQYMYNSLFIDKTWVDSSGKHYPKLKVEMPQEKPAYELRR